MIELSIIFLIIVMLLVGGFSLLHLGKKTHHSTQSSSVFTTTDFTPTQMYLDQTGGTGVAVNETTKMACLIQSSTLPPKLIHFSDLVASYVVKNDKILQKTVRAQPASMVAAAQDFQKTLEAQDPSQDPPPDDQSQKIDLCLVIHDQENPIHTINFLNMDTKEDGIIFNKAMVSAKHWHHLMTDLINHANDKESHESQPSNNHSVADELTKLGDLLQKDLISQSDFDIQKEKLLARQ